MKIAINNLSASFTGEDSSCNVSLLDACNNLFAEPSLGNSEPQTEKQENLDAEFSRGTGSSYKLNGVSLKDELEKNNEMHSWHHARKKIQAHINVTDDSPVPARILYLYSQQGAGLPFALDVAISYSTLLNLHVPDGHIDMAIEKTENNNTNQYEYKVTFTMPLCSGIKTENNSIKPVGQTQCEAFINHEGKVTSVKISDITFNITTENREQIIACCQKLKNVLKVSEFSSEEEKKLVEFAQSLSDEQFQDYNLLSDEQKINYMKVFEQIQTLKTVATNSLNERGRTLDQPLLETAHQKYQTIVLKEICDLLNNKNEENKEEKSNQFQKKIQSAEADFCKTVFTDRQIPKLVRKTLESISIFFATHFLSQKKITSCERKYGTVQSLFRPKVEKKYRSSTEAKNLRTTIAEFTNLIPSNR